MGRNVAWYGYLGKTENKENKMKIPAKEKPQKDQNSIRVKLTIEKLREIMEAAKRGLTASEISVMFGVPRTRVISAVASMRKKGIEVELKKEPKQTIYEQLAKEMKKDGN